MKLVRSGKINSNLSYYLLKYNVIETKCGEGTPKQFKVILLFTFEENKSAWQTNSMLTITLKQDFEQGEWNHC